jgi:hypothetical protein
MYIRRLLLLLPSKVAIEIGNADSSVVLKFLVEIVYYNRCHNSLPCTGNADAEQLSLALVEPLLESI